MILFPGLRGFLNVEGRLCSDWNTVDFCLGNSGIRHAARVSMLERVQAAVHAHHKKKKKEKKRKRKKEKTIGSKAGLYELEDNCLYKDDKKVLSRRNHL